MKLLNIINKTAKPALFEKGNANMWTDEYISKQLLEVHLNKELDLASRKFETINRTIDWMLSNVNNEKLKILDLGCGPGLYTEILAKKGHQVTGVDFSKTSINYAKQQAKKKNLDIQYLNENYLELDIKENQFDLVFCIFTDFGTLLPNEQEQFLAVVKKVLKNGGIFIFDVLNNTNIENKTTAKTYEVSAQGFWKNEPYLVLSESFLYSENKVILYQHTLIDEKENLDVYRFWTHFFSEEDLNQLLTKFNFEYISFDETVLLKTSMWDGGNVTFCKAINVK